MMQWIVQYLINAIEIIDWDEPTADQVMEQLLRVPYPNQRSQNQ